MAEITPENIYGDDPQHDVPWIRIHDDEVWTHSEFKVGFYVATFHSALDAQYVVDIHNAALKLRQVMENIDAVLS